MFNSVPKQEREAKRKEIEEELEAKDMENIPENKFKNKVVVIR
jgi:hypothetical protein